MAASCQIRGYFIFWFSLQNHVSFTRNKQVPYTYYVGKILHEQAKLAFLINGGILGCWGARGIFCRILKFSYLFNSLIKKITQHTIINEDIQYVLTPGLFRVFPLKAETLQISVSSQKMFFQITA